MWFSMRISITENSHAIHQIPLPNQKNGAWDAVNTRKIIFFHDTGEWYVNNISEPLL
jgi:hypothetical protein